MTRLEQKIVEAVRTAGLQLVGRIRSEGYPTEGLAVEAEPLYGCCYVLSEALYHMLPGAFAWKVKWWKPATVRVPGYAGPGAHWFLRRLLPGQDTAILDLTAKQFTVPVPYDEARGRGFLTREPSHRAKLVIARADRILHGGKRGRWARGPGGCPT